MFCPALHNSLLTEAKQVSRVALAGVAARCLQFRRDHGKYPASLDDLPGIENDPWTGKSFLLENQPDGILIRSQGELQSERDAVEWKVGR